MTENKDFARVEEYEVIDGIPRYWTVYVCGYRWYSSVFPLEDVKDKTENMVKTINDAHQAAIKKAERAVWERAIEIVQKSETVMTPHGAIATIEYKNAKKVVKLFHQEMEKGESSGK